MADNEFKADVELRRKKHRESFSNYENAVTLISSLEAWVEYRWGLHGKEQAGLLESFDRFPCVDDLTPDFEVKFRTPYVIWGDYKRTIQPASKGLADVAQIISYASRRPSAANAPPPNEGAEKVTPAPAARPLGYDVLIIVSTENDDTAAESIEAARVAENAKGANKKPPLSPIIVTGCHLDRESIEGEWYKFKWRNHHNNCRFTTPNISIDSAVPDLNKLLVDSTHHAIKVNRAALDLTGRNPFMNDAPPPMYTAIRLVIPALNGLLTADERDTLQYTGRVDKTVTKADILSAQVVQLMAMQPKKLPKWVETALEFMVDDLGCAKKMPGSEPKQYTITLDNALLRSDPREVWSDRAASKAAKIAAKRSRRKRSRDSGPGLFDSL